MTAAPPRLSEREILHALASLEDWTREGEALTKEFVLGGFAEAAQLVARLAPVADAMDHHPDVLIHRYRRVKVTLTTHAAGGITERDVALARRIDELAARAA